MFYLFSFTLNVKCRHIGNIFVLSLLHPFLFFFVRMIFPYLSRTSLLLTVCPCLNESLHKKRHNLWTNFTYVTENTLLTYKFIKKHSFIKFLKKVHKGTIKSWKKHREELSNDRRHYRAIVKVLMVLSVMWIQIQSGSRSIKLPKKISKHLLSI